MKGNAVTYALTLGIVVGSATGFAQAQPLPVTDAQRNTAQQVAAQGIPITELSPDAPDQYTVKPGDTLWRISGLFLKKPWLWPHLWGMNLQAIANPHLIYPGQVLYLENDGSRAWLSSSKGGGTVKLSPKVRGTSLADLAIPTLQMSNIQAFLTEPLVIDTNTLKQAPRIVANMDGRVILGQGDKVYARGPATALLTKDQNTPTQYRLFREAKPIKDPITGELLGYEATYVGLAELLEGETQAEENAADAAKKKSSSKNKPLLIPATLLVQQAKAEVRPGDRLVPEPPGQFHNFVPHAPEEPITAHIASVYGENTNRYGTARQVVAINKGSNDGVTPGMVLSVVSKGTKMVDKTDPTRTTIQLPNEDNGLGVVFRSFDRVAYVLLLDTQRGVQVGDELTNPR